MKRSTIRRVAAPTIAALAFGVSLSACSAQNEQVKNTSSAAQAKNVSGTLNGAGSSAQEAAQGAWTAGFQSANPNVTVNYDPSGSGAGVDQFLSGGVQFAGSDAYLTSDQVASSKKACGGSEAIEVPDYISPIAVVFNLKGVNKLQLSPDTIAQIFSGKITQWNDPAIKKENPGVKLPAMHITPVHRSDDSGTTFNFTDYLNKASMDWPNAASETWPYKSGEGAEGTSGVVAAVKHGAGTIAYADNSQTAGLTKAAVKVGSKYVAPSAQGASKAAAEATPVKGRSSSDMALTVNRTTTTSGAYPVVLISYLITCPSYNSQNTAGLVKNYATWIVSGDGQKSAAKTAGSAPLPSSLSDKATKQLSQISGS